MIKRRKFLKTGAGALLTVPGIFGGAGVANAQLCRPLNYRSPGSEPDSPQVSAYTQALFIPPAMTDFGDGTANVTQNIDGGDINPGRHQRYDEFPATQIHEQHIIEGAWTYHPDLDALTPDMGFGGAGAGSVAWMYSGGQADQNNPVYTTPGATMVSRYGVPTFVRRHNDLPIADDVVMPIGYPAMSTHLHNAHTASESDGFPMDFAMSGEFWDHHYAMQYARDDSREALASLWYHDHMIDFTATNVYAGLSGMCIFYDDLDTGDETTGLRLPGNMQFGNTETNGVNDGGSLGYDISMLLHDVRFTADGNPTYNVFDTDGHLGDLITVNRKVQPFLRVERRKYRFRIYDGGPSRFYEIGLFESPNDVASETPIEFNTITNDGNLLEAPVLATSVIVGPANRHDIIIDFSDYADGTHIEMLNLMEQVNGQGPTGRRLTGTDRMKVMQIRVEGTEPAADASVIPSALRELPDIPQDVLDGTDNLIHRQWIFDHDMGLWTVNGTFMDPTVVSAAPKQGTAEVWTFINAGSSWAHPCHVHFEECQILEWNGKAPTGVLKSRKDVMTLGPNDRVKVFYRFDDFVGRYVIHCHNNIHEDNAMMLRWDITPG